MLGFNPVARQWVTEAQAAQAPFARVPALEGELVSDAASLAHHSTDAGNSVVAVPVAVLRPASAKDISKMVKYCRRLGIQVAAHGQGHTTFGQSLVGGGLAIEMGTLKRIHSIEPGRAVVDAGLRWSELLPATLAQGLTPPVLTGYIGLSIGGTLSVGGISSGNSRGAQVDHVRELQVVTGEGDIVTCSECDNRDLFLAVLAGLGQCGIITRATIDLVPAFERARTYLLHYTDNATFFADLRTLLRRGELTDVFTLWFPDGAGGWLYQLNAVSFFNPSSPPDDAQLLRGLSFDASSPPPQDSSFYDFATRVDGAIEFFKAVGLWHNVQHPWFDVFLPEREVENYVGRVVPTLTPEDVGPTGFMLLFPQKRSKFSRPLLRLPHDEWVYLYDILTAAPQPGFDQAFEEQMLARNRRLFVQARAQGGTRYPIGSLRFDRSDWVRHYGEVYPWFARQKRRFDPDKILTPGPGIF